MAHEDKCKILKRNSLERWRGFLSMEECCKIGFNLNGFLNGVGARHDSPNINKFKLRLKNHTNIY